jgi:hypothetical protein
MTKKILFLILFVIILAGFAVYWFYMEGMFSKEILRIEILGPASAKTGDEIEYTVRYKNNGNFVLEQVKLFFEIPDNSLIEDSKTRIFQNLKDIYPGDEEFVKFKARLLGKEGDLKVVKASLSYVPKNITAPYESNATFTTKVESTEVTLDFDLPSKIEKGKDLQYSINYFSNINYPLENLSIRVDRVSGFDFGSSVPSSLDGLEWKLDTLNKAEGGRINIKGKISADDNQKLTFNAKLGMRVNGNFIVIKESTIEVQVIQPLLFISQQVNGSADYVASPGETLHYQIFFRNIGSSPFDNLFMVAKLDGQSLDMSTIKAEGGQVQDNMIIWDSRQMSQLMHLDVQQEGEVNFDVKVKSNWAPLNQDSGNTTISDEVNISQITKKFTIKVNSGLTISQRAYYKSSDIVNAGFIPPKVGQDTTYTISWDIKNYFSDAKNVKVKAVLPQNVSLTGQIFPQNEFSKFSFDSASREIVWSAGDILAGTGVSGDPVSLYFQVSLKPMSSQKGSLAQIIGEANITGENQFTNTIITASDSAVNTSLPDDFANSGGGIVQ